MKTVAIGEWRSVAFEVAAWDGAGAEVDLSAACLFEREADGVTLAGGARHLDQMLGGALLALRAAGSFRATAGETLLLDRLPEGIVARAVLIVGLGDPGVWTPERSAMAAAASARLALARGDASAAFAPSLLDAGLHAAGAGGDILTAVAQVIDTATAGIEAGLAEPLALRRFVFDAGKAHIDIAVETFRRAFAALADQSPPPSPLPAALP